MPIELLGLILVLPATFYYGIGIFAAIAFFSKPVQNYPNFQPPVTIIKPICGLDQDTYKNFSSCCQQEYPQYQIIFAVRDPNDPAIAVVKKIQQDFPAVDIELWQCDRLFGSNYKVSNLANALPHAKYEILVLADSDVRVDQHYLQRLVQPLQDPAIGAVTCLYRPIMQGWVATLEAIGISTDYLASVLVANQLEGIKFALGPTIAIRKEVLAKFGGFEAIADYLADDYQIGYLTVQAGYKVVLSDYIIDHMITTESFGDLMRRQMRWAYCTKVSRPMGYLGLFFTHGTVTSLLFLLLTGGSVWGWGGIAIAWATRLIMAGVVGIWGLKDKLAYKFLWLVPIRDILSFGIWCYSWFTNSVDWRGRKLRLSKDGKLV
jgi:ceramide glucosyltransferase